MKHPLKIMKHEFLEQRLTRLKNFLQEKNLDAVLISKKENIRYFSNFSGDDSFLIACANGKNFLVTDFRYTEQAQSEIDETQCTLIEHTEGLQKKTKEILQNFSSVACEGASLSFDAAQKLFSKNVSSVDLNFLREQKDDSEIKNIRQAIKITDDAFAHILKFFRENIQHISDFTEQDVRAELEFFMTKHGSDRPAFETIVASGVRGSLPHGFPTQKKLALGEFVTMDFGAVYGGYCADMTRTICLGRATDEMKKIYDIVLQAQLLGTQKIKSGMSGQEIDFVVRKKISDAGYGKNFGHGLGHGVGLEIHEAPSLSPKSLCKKILENSIVTIEPGIYIQNFGGVRIEDSVLVKKNSIDILCQSPKQLIEIF